MIRRFACCDLLHKKLEICRRHLIDLDTEAVMMEVVRQRFGCRDCIYAPKCIGMTIRYGWEPKRVAKAV